MRVEKISEGENRPLALAMDITPSRSSFRQIEERTCRTDRGSPNPSQAQNDKEPRRREGEGQAAAKQTKGAAQNYEAQSLQRRRLRK